MPQTLNISRTIHSQSQFIKNASDSSKGLNENKEMILRRAVVVDINREGLNIGKTNLSNPPYAICAVILDEGVHAKRPDLVKKKKWYPPLLPMTNISIPEIGEEVFIIKEQNVKSSFGYWVGKVNNYQYLNYSGAKHWQENKNQRFANGEIDIDGMRRDTPIKSPKKDKYVIPVLDGDVIQQGRHGTYLRHSFDILNDHSPLIEFGVNAPIRKGIKPDSPTIGVTRTKTIHAGQTPLSRYVGVRQLVNKNLKAYVGEPSDLVPSNANGPPVVKNYELDYENKYDYIINLAERHVNISIQSGTGNSVDEYLYRQVLGDKNKESLQQIIGVVNQLKKIVVEIYELYKDHTHNVSGEVFNYEQKIGKNGGDINIEFEIEDQDTKPIKKQDVLVEIDEKFEEFEETILEVNEKLEDTLSNTQFVQ